MNNNKAVNLFKKKLFDGNFKSVRKIYKNNTIKLSEIDQSFMSRIDSYKIAEWVIQILKNEMIYDVFVRRCLHNQDPKQYYESNREYIELLVQRFKPIYELLLEPSVANDTLIYLKQIGNVDEEILFNDMMETVLNENDIDKVTLLCSRFENKFVSEYDIDDYFCTSDNFVDDIRLLDLGFKLQDGEIIEQYLMRMMRTESLQLINSFCNKCPSSDCDYGNLFFESIKLNKLNVTLYFYSKMAPFRSKFDDRYDTAINYALRYQNFIVAQWLVSLYDLYMIANIQNTNGHVTFTLESKYPDSDTDDDSSEEESLDINIPRTAFRVADVHSDSDDDDEEDDCNFVFKVITEHINNKQLVYDLLGITQSFANTEDDVCLICRDTPQNLLKLSCSHLVCIDCIAKWYLENEEKCPYCSKQIIWSACNYLKQ